MWLDDRLDFGSEAACVSRSVSLGSMASTGFHAASVRRDLRFTEQAIEVVAHHRLVLTALLKQKTRQR